MIHHYQRGKGLELVSKTTPQQQQQRRQKQITVKFDIELSNQVDFLAKHLEIKKLEVLRQLVKKQINELGLWKSYQKSEKKYNETELLLQRKN